MRVSKVVCEKWKEGQTGMGALQRSLCTRDKAGWVVWGCGQLGYLSRFLSADKHCDPKQLVEERVVFILQILVIVVGSWSRSSSRTGA